jgi:hypothetical protein
MLQQTEELKIANQKKSDESRGASIGRKTKAQRLAERSNKGCDEVKSDATNMKSSHTTSNLSSLSKLMKKQAVRGQSRDKSYVKFRSNAVNDHDSKIMIFESRHKPQAVQHSFPPPVTSQ